MRVKLKKLIKRRFYKKNNLIQYVILLLNLVLSDIM